MSVRPETSPYTVSHGPGHRVRRPSGEPPPLPRQLNKAAIAWLAVFVFWLVVWVWVFLSSVGPIWITERDLELMGPIVDNRASWLTPTMQWFNDVGTNWAVPVIGWITIVGALVARRIRHVVLFFISLFLVTGFLVLITNLDVAAGPINRPRPLGMTQIGDWSGFAQPSRPCGLLAATCVAAGLTLLPAGPWRRRWWIAVSMGFGAFAYAQLYTGVEHPSDIFAGATVGVAFTLVLFRLFAPEEVFPIAPRTGNSAHLDITGPRGAAIKFGLRTQLGVEAGDISPVGLEGSAGSTPLRIEIEPGGRNPSEAGGEAPTELFIKLYARSHLRSDRSYKLFRTLVYGRLEDETRYTSVRRLVQHEDYMLHVMRRAGIPSPEPYGIVEITPDREYLLVNEFLHDAVEISEADVTEEVIDEGLAVIAALWKAGLAHRDIKPANLMVQDGHIRVIDVAFGQIRPSPWRQAVDLANMMLVLALGSSPELVYERALQHFSEQEIAEAFAASRGVTLPSALRSDVRRDGRDLLARFRELAPTQEKVAIQRWSLRRVGLTAWVVVVALLSVSFVLGSLSTIGLSPHSEAPPETVLAPVCSGATSGLIVAQSVSTATVVPCILELPVDWMVESVSVNQDRTVVHLSSDRAGVGNAVFRFQETCDVGTARAVESEDPRISRFEAEEPSTGGYDATWFAVVEGGCWLWEFDLGSSGSASLAAEIDAAMGWISRDDLNVNISETFIDEEL